MSGNMDKTTETLIKTIVDIQCTQQQQIGQLQDGQKSLLDLHRAEQEIIGSVQMSQIEVQKSHAALVDLVLENSNNEKGRDETIQRFQDQIAIINRNNSNTTGGSQQATQVDVGDIIVEGVCGGCNIQRYRVSVKCIVVNEKQKNVCPICHGQYKDSYYRSHIKKLCYPKTQCCRRPQ